MLLSCRCQLTELFFISTSQSEAGGNKTKTKLIKAIKAIKNRAALFSLLCNAVAVSQEISFVARFKYGAVARDRLEIAWSARLARQDNSQTSDVIRTPHKFQNREELSWGLSFEFELKLELELGFPRGHP